MVKATVVADKSGMVIRCNIWKTVAPAMPAASRVRR